MPSATRTEHACIKDALAPVPRVTARVVDVMDEHLFPEIAEARRHLASLSPERRAELERDWL